METRKILGQINPLATTNGDLYTVPTSTQAIVSSITICNTNLTGGGSAKYRIAIRQNGAALANKHYICYDRVISINTTQTIVIGITLGANDIITVYADTADVVYNAYGVELT